MSLEITPHTSPDDDSRGTIFMRSLMILTLLGWLASSSSVAQQPTTAETDLRDQDTVDILIDQGGEAVQRLAIPAATRPPALISEAAMAADELEATLRSDLELTGIFAIQGPDDLRALALTGERDRDFELYRSLGNELLLTSEIKLASGNKLVLEGRMYDLKGRTLILGKRYTGGYDVARRIAHSFTDEIVLYFTGRTGIARTVIAFSSDRDGNQVKELYLMDYDGYDQRPISGHRSLSLAPSWAPNGDGLAYASYYQGSPSLYWVERRTGTKRPVLVDDVLSMSPSFSPDGRRITFYRALDGNSDIFIIERDGSQMKRLTSSSRIDANPSWGPTGQTIAFTSNRSGTPQIYLMDAEGSNVRRVTFDGRYNEGASWHPDGNRIVYSKRSDDARRFDVAMLDLVTLETTILTGPPGSHEAPSFSPDGRLIAYQSQRGSSTQIYMMTLDGRNVRRLTSTGNNFDPSWSPYLE